MGGRPSDSRDRDRDDKSYSDNSNFNSYQSSPVNNKASSSSRFYDDDRYYSHSRRRDNDYYDSYYDSFYVDDDYYYKSYRGDSKYQYDDYYDNSRRSSKDDRYYRGPSYYSRRNDIPYRRHDSLEYDRKSQGRDRDKDYRGNYSVYKDDGKGKSTEKDNFSYRFSNNRKHLNEEPYHYSNEFVYGEPDTNYYKDKDSTAKIVENHILSLLKEINPLAPPIKPENTRNFNVISKKPIQIRYDGEGLESTLTDPRNKSKILNRDPHAKIYKYRPNLILVEYDYDQYSCGDPPPTGVCIIGLSKAHNENALKKYFSANFGTIVKASLEYDKLGSSLGIFWIKFNDSKVLKNLKSLEGKELNLGLNLVDSKPIKILIDDDQTKTKKVANDIIKSDEDKRIKDRMIKKEQRIREINKKSESSSPAQKPLPSLPKPSTELGFKPFGARTGKSWSSFNAEPLKPVKVERIGSDDEGSDDEHARDLDVGLYRGRFDNENTRKKDSPVKKKQSEMDIDDQKDNKVDEDNLIPPIEKAEKYGNPYIFIDKVCLPVNGEVSSSDLRVYFTKFKVSEVLFDDNGWYILFSKQDAARRAIVVNEGNECFGYKINLILRDPKAREIEAQNELQKKTKLSEKRTLTEDEMDEITNNSMIKDKDKKIKKGKTKSYVKRRDKTTIDFTSSESDDDEKKLLSKPTSRAMSQTSTKVERPSIEPILDNVNESKVENKYKKSYKSFTSTQKQIANPFKAGVTNSEEDLYYLKCVLDRDENNMRNDIEDLMMIHAFAPSDYREEVEPEQLESYENKLWSPPIHESGSSRTEGYYQIPEVEKAAYLPQRNKANSKVEAITNDKVDKISSRANRSNARTLAHGLGGNGASDGEILKFNQLRTRKKELRFAKSSIHSWGLYSCQNIPKGEMVIEYVGEVVRQQVADRREKSYEKQGIGSSYLFKIDDDNM